INAGPYTGDGIAFQLLGTGVGMSDIYIVHNTIRNGPSTYSNQAIMSDGDRVNRLNFSAQAMYSGTYGVFMSSGAGAAALAKFAPGAGFVSNLLVGADCTKYPATTICPATMPSALPLAADGLSVGADLARIDAETSAAVVAP
ncbi:MAG: hypothetical protein JWM93_2047, partial [Frankiales bacterium]|nr:hypothetical protein [Frankiales bacterium]